MSSGRFLVLFFLLSAVSLKTEAREPAYRFRSNERSNSILDSFTRKTATKIDLHLIIVNAGPEFRKQAARALLARDPDLYDLLVIVHLMPGTVEQLTAAGKLLRRKLDVFDLAEIICYAPEPHKGFAWKTFLQQKPKNRDFWRVMICAGSGEYAGYAAIKLFRQGQLTDEDLSVISIWGPPRLVQEAVKFSRLRQTAHDRLMRVRARSFGATTHRSAGNSGGVKDGSSARNTRAEKNNALGNNQDSFFETDPEDPDDPDDTGDLDDSDD